MEYYKNGNPKTDDLQIFTGAQQVIDLTAKCFLNSGDVVLTEEPQLFWCNFSFLGV